MSFLDREFKLEVLKGNVRGNRLIFRFGRNDSVPNNTWVGLLQNTSSFYWIQSPTLVRVRAGGSAADTYNGLGAQAVTVCGIDESGSYVSESIELSGSLASSYSRNYYWRVCRTMITEGRVGTYNNANSGSIILETSGSNKFLMQISPEEGESQYCAFSTARGDEAYLLSVVLHSDSSKPSDFRLFTRRNYTKNTTPFTAKQLRVYWDAVQGQTDLNPDGPILKLDELSDIWIEVEGHGGVSNAAGDIEVLIVSKN